MTDRTEGIERLVRGFGGMLRETAAESQPITISRRSIKLVGHWPYAAVLDRVVFFSALQFERDTQQGLELEERGWFWHDGNQWEAAVACDMRTVERAVDAINLRAMKAFGVEWDKESAEKEAQEESGRTGKHVKAHPPQVVVETTLRQLLRPRTAGTGRTRAPVAHFRVNWLSFPLWVLVSSNEDRSILPQWQNLGFYHSGKFLDFTTVVKSPVYIESLIESLKDSINAREHDSASAKSKKRFTAPEINPVKDALRRAFYGEAAPSGKEWGVIQRAAAEILIEGIPVEEIPARHKYCQEKLSGHFGPMALLSQKGRYDHDIAKGWKPKPSMAERRSGSGSKNRRIEGEL